MFIEFSDDWKQLRRLITALLRSWAVTEIKRFNYIKSYKLIGKKIQKEEQKVLRLNFDPQNKNKVTTLLQKFNTKEISKTTI